MTISAQVIGTAPPFVRVTISGQTAASWSLVRVLGAQTEVVRGGAGRTEAGTVVDDTEAPLSSGSFVYWLVDDSDGSTVESSSSVTPSATGYVWLSDPVTLSSARLQVDEWPEVAYPFRGGVFRVVGRPNAIVVSDARSGAEGTMEASTQTSAERGSLLDLLEASVVFQLRAVCPEVWHGYWSATDVTERREANDGSDPRRRWSLTLVQADRPDLALLPTTDTLADLHADLGGDGVGTLLLLSQSYPGTLLDVASASLTTLTP